MDADRRQRLIELFTGPRFKSDRATLIKQSDLTKGRVAQFFNETQAFGERAARALAVRLELPENYFELPAASPLAALDEDTLAFAITYQRLLPDERHKMRLLYEVARAGKLAAIDPVLPANDFNTLKASSGAGSELQKTARQKHRPAKQGSK